MGKPIPEGYHTVTPALVVRDAAKAIDFYKRAFGAAEISRLTAGDKIGHAELRIGNSIIMLSDEWPQSPLRAPESLGGTTVSLNVYMEDVDTAYNRAVSAGAESEMKPEDMFWGDRYSKVKDPFGHSWGLLTHIKDVSREEMQKAMDAMMSKMAQCQHG